MFTEALFTIARAQKQPKCPSTEEWKKKMWYITTKDYMGILFSYKTNKIMSFAEMWMDLETVIQSEINRKNIHCILRHICGI